MRLKFIAISLCILSLSACGGGSNGTTGAAATGPIPQYTSTAVNFANGFVLSKVTDQAYGSNGGTFDAVIATASTETADKAFDAMLKVNDSDPSVMLERNTLSFGDYSATAEGVLTNGESFSNNYAGTRLSSGGYVSINILGLGSDEGAFATDGTSPFGVTPASATYQGSSLFVGEGPNNSAVTEVGTFQMAVDFANGSANLSASSATGSLTASGIVVSDISSQINATGLISLGSQTPTSASILGFFSGQDGAGVHGIGFADTTTDGGTAAMFMGKR